jgi:ribose 5-phosphate isomerase B
MAQFAPPRREDWLAAIIHSPISQPSFFGMCARSGEWLGKLPRQHWESEMRVAVGANKRGFAVRDRVVQLLQRLGHAADAIEIPEGQVADYPEIAARLAKQVQQGSADRGILIGRTGMGMCIVANRFHGIQAAVCQDEFSAETCRRYLDVNVLCLSAEMLGELGVERIIETWLKIPFEGGRHAHRIERISALEKDAITGGKS